MKAIFRNTWAILTSNEKKNFGFLIFLDFVISLADIIALAVLLWIVQFYVQADSTERFGFLPQWMDSRESVWVIAIFFFLFACKNLAGYFITKAQYHFNSQVAIRISRNNLSNFQHAGFDEFISVDSSKHIRKICFEPFEFCQYILSGIQQIITQSCLIVIASLAILVFNAKLFLLLLLLLLPPVIVVFYLARKKMASARKSIRVNNEQSYQYLLDALKGWVESNIYNRHNFFLERFMNSRKQFSIPLFDTLALQSMPSRIIEVFAIMGLFILIAIAKWSGNNDSASLLTIGAFMAAAYKIIPGIVKITNISGQMRAYEFSATDLVQVRPATENPAKETAAVRIQSLQLKNISFAYGDHQVLKDFNLCFQKEDFIGISGASGKGKTTVLNILLGFLEPSTGSVLINESLMTKERIQAYWPRVAYVRQQSFLIHDTILKNITLEDNEPDKEKLEYAIKSSGLNPFICESANRFEKMIMENGKNISGGQQQRISIARALYKESDLIILDEPFNELDEESEHSLLTHFRELAGEGRIVILVTHNKNSLAFCDQIISLDE